MRKFTDEMLAVVPPQVASNMRLLNEIRAGLIGFDQYMLLVFLGLAGTTFLVSRPQPDFFYAAILLAISLLCQIIAIRFNRKVKRLIREFDARLKRT